MKALIEEANGFRPVWDLLKNSLLWRELKAEHDEILRHKWLESEKIGYDIGFGFAQVDWNLRHRSGWRKARMKLAQSRCELR